MSTFFLADLIPGMLLTPLKSSRKFLDFLLSFHSFLVSDTFFDAFAQSFHSLFLFLGCTSPQFDES